MCIRDSSTAAPVCIAIPISTWAVFYSGLFEDFGVTRGGSGADAYICLLYTSERRTP